MFVPKYPPFLLSNIWTEIHLVLMLENLIPGFHKTMTFKGLYINYVTQTGEEKGFAVIVLASNFEASLILKLFVN
jgi:hypothetical protein